jgi:putative intracellular protease/amidase
MWDFSSNAQLSRIAAAIYERGYVVSAVCHGPAGLLNIKLSNGSYLIEGKEVTGFSNEEETLVMLTSDVPYLLEDELDKKSGGHFKQSVFPFASFTVTSGRLVTGQNPGSTDATAEAVIEVLKTIAESKGAR